MPDHKNKIEDALGEFSKAMNELNGALETFNKMKKSVDRLDIVETHITNLAICISKQAETIDKLNMTNSAIVDNVINLQMRLERIEALLLKPPNPKNVN